ncbi:hypothetical protein MYX04_14040 [Nitrospiraceae bacterium AH_259_D15_M11_P09]|nr:hypothetical protein [Nitrospiraceae bacterium AH_259_D15_M11_P09]
MTATDSLAAKIAAAILLKEGKIAVSDIRALPFVETDEKAMAVARELASQFEVDIEQIKDSSPFAQWTDVLTLKAARRQAINR